MNNKTIAMVIVAVLAVAAVGVGIYFIYGNEDTRGTMSFLIEDGESDPFWIEGRGDDGMSAFIDACDKNGVSYEKADSEYGAYIVSISEIEGNYPVAWWALYIYTDGVWEESMVGISSLESSEVRYVAWVYTGEGELPSLEPSTA